MEQGDARIEAAAEAALAHRRGRGRPREDPLRGQGEEVWLARKAATAAYRTLTATQGASAAAAGEERTSSLDTTPLARMPLALASTHIYGRNGFASGFATYCALGVARFISETDPDPPAPLILSQTTVSLGCVTCVPIK